jgi:hypothetical protein
MNINDILNKKGTIVTVTAQKSVKVKKGRAPITKLSVFQARLGINYDNMASVKEKRDNGILPEQNQGLPWGNWKVFPYVIEHNGKEYIRFSKVNSSMKTKTHYYRNGIEITRDEVYNDCLASEKPKDTELDCFNIPADNIIEIKG